MMPTKIQIGPYPYSIVDWPVAAANEAACYGQCDYDKLEIRVRQDLKPSRKAEVLLHEILHACWEVGTIPANPEEEHAVNALGIHLTNAMRTNPEVFRWIINSARKAK